MRAQQRASEGDEYASTTLKKVKVSDKEEFLPAPESALGPDGSTRAFLKARQEKLDLESKAGTSELVNPNEEDGVTKAGYFCEVCACLLKDSASYLDHINGKKRNLLFTF